MTSSNNKLIKLFLLPPASLLLVTATFAQKGVTEASVTEEFSKGGRVRSGVALGGIGTGSVELRKDGIFYNWAIFNNYPKGTGPIFELPTRPYSDEEDGFYSLW